MLKKIIIALLALIALYLGASTLYPAEVAQTLVKAEYARVHLERKELDTDGGLQWVYLDGGSGAPLVLVHGFGADKDNWTKVAEYLTPHYRVIAPDLIGFGDSSHPQDASYTIDAQTERLHAFVQKLGLQKIAIGGNSMGGNIAMAYAAKYPDEVQSLWLLAPAGINTAPPSELRQIIAKNGENPLLAQNEAQFQQIFSFVMMDPPYIPSVILRYKAQQRISNYALEQRIFKEILNSPGMEDRIKGLATPTLVIWGDHDRALSYQGAQIITSLMPKASALIMRDVGHVPMLERPGESVQAYLDFQAQLK